MPLLLMILLSLHVLAAIFWAGSTFTLARNGGTGAEALFRPQMGAAVLVVLTGGYLWHLTQSSATGASPAVLGLGALAALVAAGIQGAMKARPAVSHRIAAALLALTAVCMVIAPYA